MMNIIHAGIATLLISSCGYQSFDECKTPTCCQEAYDDCYSACVGKERSGRYMCNDVCRLDYQDCLKNVKASE